MQLWLSVVTQIRNCVLLVVVILILPLALSGAPARGADGSASPRATRQGMSGELVARPGLADIGRRMFFDQQLSADGQISCATCHVPEKAFTDGRKLAVGIGGQVGTRNTPSILNAGSSAFQFWDGRREHLEQQVLDPFVNPREHGLSSAAELVQIVQKNADYRRLMLAAFSIPPKEIQATHVAQALAAYIRTLESTDSPTDRFLYANQKEALTPEAARGLMLFRGRAQCASCHSITDQSAPLADDRFHSLAIGFERLGSRLPELARRVARAPRGDRDRLILEDSDIAALGRFAVTLDPRDVGKFKTPSLRNVALTAPYMHDGSIATLQEAVDHEIYYRSQAMGRPLVLTPTERTDLVAFLRALTSSRIPQ